ncbi:MAG: pyridoxine biosynthesis protein [Chrysothrix sp. TS-e1954]|nr:MAG: pyridoxine biosynthesis protein [Chrysothrix sp. TS-e1954]
MSPTMTEGNIAAWKVKEGDTFSTGDVLLEIETDKAQMDVEAPEDGIVAKLMKADGSKGVKVGTRIAVLAEEGDDLATLELPAEEQRTLKSASRAESGSQKRQERPSPVSDSTQTSQSSPQQTTQSSESRPHSARKFPLYPAVEHLLHANGLSDANAASIPASGPNGRLLKGDVLAHLGRIQKEYSSEQSKRITMLGHLDLSNVKRAAPKPAPEALARTETKTEAAFVEESSTEIALPISLSAVLATQRRIQDSLGLKLPLSTFIARASEIANENLPKARNTVPTADELFDAVLGLDKVRGANRWSRGRYTPMVTTLPGDTSNQQKGSAPNKVKQNDIIDSIAGTSGVRRSTAVAPGGYHAASSSNNVFSVSASKGEERRVRTYLERVKTVLESEPGRCVL